MSTVPLIDLGPFRHGNAAARAEVAAQVDRACREIGFLVVANHGVPDDLIEATRAVSRAYFDLPLEEKMRVVRPAPDVTRGYIGLEAESVARARDASATAGDLNESLMIGPVDLPPADYAFAPAAGKHFAPNLWPEHPAALPGVWSDYYRAMGALAETIMRVFALGLRLDEHYFDTMVDRHISRLRVRNYPAPSTVPQPGQLRAGAHSDYGSLTILHTEDKPGGLQVFTKAGAWEPVPILPGCFVVNIGDLMERWTNDAWVSTLHRVVVPPAGAGAESRRQSLVFFHNPNYDAAVAALPGTVAAGAAPIFPPTTSGEHLRAQFVRTQVPAA